MKEERLLQSIPDDDLLRRLADLVGESRRVEVDIVAHIAEVEERRLYAREAFASMFVYVRDVLHFSEHEAYLRIAVARASREHPILLTMLADGRLHLTAIGKLAPHLTRQNRDWLLERATHKTKRQLEEFIAEIAPRPDVPAVVRKLPEKRALPTAGPLVGRNSPQGSKPGADPMFDLRPDPMIGLGPDQVAAPESGEPGDDDAFSHRAPHTQILAVAHDASEVVASRHPSAPPVSPSVVQPLSPGRYKVQFTASAEFQGKLERLRALMGSRGPGGDLAAVIEQAVTEKLERLEARRFARTVTPRKDGAGTDPSPSLRKVPAQTKTARSPSSSSRYIPAAVRRAVRERDGNRCCYVDEQGRRCPEQNRLEFHHRHPFGLGGEHSVANVGLVCRAHNAYLAACDYGWQAMARHRRPPNRADPPPAG